MPEQNIDSLLNQASEHLDANRLQEARELYSRISRQDPTISEAWLMLAAINGETGLVEEALENISEAIRHDPSRAEAHMIQARLLAARGELEAAANSCQHAGELEPDDLETWIMLAGISGQLGNLDLAETAARHAVRLQADSPQALINLANTLAEKNLLDEAARHYTAALELAPALTEVWNILGSVQARRGQHEAAVTAYRKAVAKEPGSAAYQLGLGTSLINLGHTDEARQHLETVLQLDPDNIDARMYLGNIFMEVGAYEEATACLEEVLRRNPDSAHAHYFIGRVMQSRGDMSDALEYYRKATALDPGFSDAVAAEASALDHMGELKQAYDKLQPLLVPGQASPVAAISFARLCKHFDECERASQLLENLLNDGNTRIAVRADMHYTLGDILNHAGKYDEAFEHYKQANALRHVDYDKTAFTRYSDLIISVFSKETLDSLPSASNSSSRPVFIVGMPRSGTTLTEQIIASHPGIHGAGELREMQAVVRMLPELVRNGAPYPQCASALTQLNVDRLASQYLNYLDTLSSDADRVIDKMPHNFLHLGMIQLLFPGARVIHCMRDPLDTCLSIYFHNFNVKHPYASDLASTGEEYRRYQHLMAHWKATLSIPIMDVRYEELVEDQERVSRNLIEFCGLDWDNRVMQFHDSGRVVGTPSYDQVRQPIYKKSVSRWKNYEQHLAPLRESLGMQD